VILSTIGVLLGLMVIGPGVRRGDDRHRRDRQCRRDREQQHRADRHLRPLRREGVAAYEAILETCRERARPVVLTAVTAILGVLPIAFGVNLDFVLREVTVGAPATQWWISLSTAIVFGLGFATLLTLIVTPAALMAIAQLAEKRGTLDACGADESARRSRAWDFARAKHGSPPAPAITWADAGVSWKTTADPVRPDSRACRNA
jgi:multidrug efflux pump